MVGFFTVAMFLGMLNSSWLPFVQMVKTDGGVKEVLDNSSGTPWPQNNIYLEHQKIGDGTTPIAFLNGFRMQFKTWDKVYPEIIHKNCVILFNRRGVGTSLKATEEQDGNTVISEMRALFSTLGLSPPYVLVAHSLGGLFANLYARTHPNEVAGIVFVDSPHPSEVAEQKKKSPPFVLKAINNGLKTIERLFDKYKYSEDECIEKTIAQIKNAGDFPDIPIAVVSGAKKMPFVPEKLFAIHQQYQTQLLNLSSKSTHYICPESGHFPQITEPEKVITAIQYILNETKIRYAVTNTCWPIHASGVPLPLLPPKARGGVR
jgi:pimeloyl-ACP methyl ester carboxylesterase